MDIQKLIDLVAKELVGYRVKAILLRIDPDKSKPFEDLDFSRIMELLNKVFPGFDISLGSDWEYVPFDPDDSPDEPCPACGGV